MKISKSLMLLGFMFLGILTTMQYSSLHNETKNNTSSARVYKERYIDLWLQNRMAVWNWLAEVEANRQNINLFKIEYGKTLLQKIARLGEWQLVEKCLQLGANINAQDDNGWTALFDAVLSSNLDTVRVLVEAGIDLRLKDNQGRNIIDFVREESLISPFIRFYIEEFEQLVEFQTDSNPEIEQYPESLTF